MENEICLKQPKPDKPGREERLAAFAKSHFIISGIGFAVGLILFAISTFIPHFLVYALAEIILLSFYGAAGFWHARQSQWRISCFKEWLWTFLSPALIAWGWAALVLLSLFLNVFSLLSGMFVASAFLAFPSFLMVILALISNWLGSEASFVLWAILAGAIPPLLFTLGSLWGNRKNKAKTDENEFAEVREDDGDV